METVRCGAEMYFTIEFYRQRKYDGARARLALVGCDAKDSTGAIDMARKLRRTIELPQKPDKFRVLSSAGMELFRGAAD